MSSMVSRTRPGGGAGPGAHKPVGAKSRAAARSSRLRMFCTHFDVGLQRSQLVLEFRVVEEAAGQRGRPQSFSPGPTLPFSTMSVSSNGTMPVSDPTTSRPSQVRE